MCRGRPVVRLGWLLQDTATGERHTSNNLLKTTPTTAAGKYTTNREAERI
jgi:hypothetical protein